MEDGRLARPAEMKIRRNGPRRAPHLHPVFLRHRWDDTVQAQVLDELSIMVGDVPHSNDGDTEFGVRPGITPFDAVQRVLRRECGENTVGVVERVLEIFNQLGFCFRRIVASLFAVVGWFLALEFVEEGELCAGDVIHLFAKTAGIVELSDCRDEGIFVFRHGLSDGEKITFRELECAANAFRDGLGNVVLRGGLLGGGVLCISRFPDSREGDTPDDKKGSDAKKFHLILLDSGKDKQLRLWRSSISVF